MALTRPKYSQIFDSDFKNSCRAATTTNVTLTGAAPKVVDGVTLKLYDRVLVKAQTNTTQNGIYFVTTLGTGSNGTWTRTQDASDGTRLTSGTSLSVEEGSTFGGKLFRMTTPNPITLGTSEITWVDVSGGGGAASGNDGQVQYNDNNAPAGAGYLFYNKVSGQVKANATTSSTSTTTGALIVTGGVGISENLYVGGSLDVAGTVTFHNSVVETSTEFVQGVEIVAGNLVANSGTTSSSTTTGALVVAGGAGISGAVYAGSIVNTPISGSTGSFTTLTNSGILTSNGNLVAASGTASLSTTTGALVVVGGIGASGAVYAGSIQNTPIGSTTASSGAFTTITASSTLTATGVSTLNGNVVAASGTSSSSTTTGALVVTGGAGVSGELYVGANVTVTGNVLPSANVTYNLGSPTQRWKDLYLSGTTINLNGATISATNGAVTFQNSLGGSFSVTGAASGQSTGTFGNLVANSGVTSTTTGTGALVVTGGAGISGTMNVGGNASFGANVSITGNLTVTGQSVSIGSSTLSIQDPVINLHTASDLTPLTSNDLADIGLKFHYYDIADSAAFLGRANDTGYLEWYARGSDTANVFTGTAYGTIKSGEMVVANATASSSTTTGALRVTGGVGIAGAAYVGGVLNAAGAATLQSTLGVTGLITSTGGISGGAASHTTGSFSGVITSTVTTGTAPFTVASTTAVTNLNADLWDGNHFADYINQAVKTTSAPTFAGLTTSAAIVPNANLTINVGSSTAWFNTFYGVSTQAKYADLAEKYTSDAAYTPGTVVVFGGTAEVTTTTQDHDTRVAGVVSTDPAYLMNAMESGVAVALTGRVPCFVQGPVNQGDVLVTSANPGVAQKIDNSKFLPGCIIGKALESINTNNIETIEVVVGRF